MGLGASRLPIDLAAGDVFGNLDHLGDPSTNLLYGARVITTVDLDGHFVQTDQGHMVFDAAFGPYGSDRVNVTGDAVVAGTGTVTLTWLENAAPVTLFATGGSGFDNGLEFEDTLAMDYSVLADAAGVHLTFVSDFGQPFLNANGQALGGHMDSALIAGGASGIGRMMAMVGNLQAGEEDLYAAIFDQLNPEPHLAAARAHLDSAQSFGDQIFTCGAALGGATEGCVWGLIERVMAEGDADADFGAYGTEYSATRLRSGFERPVAGGWSFAGAVGYERLLNLYVDDYRAHTRGTAFNLGFGARHRSANGLEFGASVSGGWQWAETLRRVDVFQPGIGESRPESGYAQAAGHIAYTARGGPFFVRPALNGSVTVLRQQGFAEEGLGGLGARRQSGEQTFGTLNPELTLGVMLHESAASRAAFSITAGSIHHSEDRIEAPFRLMGADTASDPAMIASPLDPSGYHLGAELNIIGGDRLSFRFSYDGRFDDRSETHAAGFNMRLRF